MQRIHESGVLGVYLRPVLNQLLENLLLVFLGAQQQRSDLVVVFGLHDDAGGPKQVPEPVLVLLAHVVPDLEHGQQVAEHLLVSKLDGQVQRQVAVGLDCALHRVECLANPRVPALPHELAELLGALVGERVEDRFLVQVRLRDPEERGAAEGALAEEG